MTSMLPSSKKTKSQGGLLSDSTQNPCRGWASPTLTTGTSSAEVSWNSNSRVTSLTSKTWRREMETSLQHQPWPLEWVDCLSLFVVMTLSKTSSMTFCPFSSLDLTFVNELLWMSVMYDWKSDWKSSDVFVPETGQEKDVSSDVGNVDDGKLTRGWIEWDKGKEVQHPFQWRMFPLSFIPCLLSSKSFLFDSLYDSPLYCHSSWCQRQRERQGLQKINALVSTLFSFRSKQRF